MSETSSPVLSTGLRLPQNKNLIQERTQKAGYSNTFHRGCGIDQNYTVPTPSLFEISPLIPRDNKKKTEDRSRPGVKSTGAAYLLTYWYVQHELDLMKLKRKKRRPFE